MNFANELLKRAEKLLGKGNVRYSDRIFEDERAKLVEDIQEFLKNAPISEPESESDAKKRIYLPVIKGDV